jgi:hypothetical protein
MQKTSSSLCITPTNTHFGQNNTEFQIHLSDRRSQVHKTTLEWATVSPDTRIDGSWDSGYHYGDRQNSFRMYGTEFQIFCINV